MQRGGRKLKTEWPSGGRPSACWERGGFEQGCSDAGDEESTLERLLIDLEQEGRGILGAGGVEGHSQSMSHTFFGEGNHQIGRSHFSE